MERISRIAGRSKAFNNTQTPDALAQAAWVAAVGKRLAAKPFLLRLFGSKLVVEVGDAVWQQQLTTMSGMLLEGMRKALGFELVKELEFRVGAQTEAPRKGVASEAILDEADTIQDPMLRLAYRSSRKRSNG
jgi:hypothetical protein